jgi:hypothetical protein
MKKIYILLLSITTGLFATAQNSISTDLVVKNDNSIHKIKPSNTTNQSKGVVVWSNEFDNSADWVLANDCAYSSYTISGGYDYVAGSATVAASACTGSGTTAQDPNTGSAAQFRFENDPNLIPVSVLAPMGSATASNGYLFINSDACGGGDNDGTPIFVTATIANAIDLSSEPSVVLSFSHNYRWWQDTRGVRVSGDNGATWYQYELTNNSGYQNDQNSGNPEITSIDVSAVAGGQSQVLVQFYYEDNDYWAWYWAVDDVQFSRKDQHNVQNLAAWVYGESTYFAEYGRTPISQMDANWVIGSQVANDGVSDQTNVTLNADFGSFTASSSIAVLEADSAYYVESLEPLTLAAGTYQGTFTVSSDSDQVGGANFGDNVLERNFEITNDVYSLDGIGNHPSGLENLGSYGSYSWPLDAADGLVCATMYPFKQDEVVNSVTAFITSNTVENSELLLYLIDSTSFTSGLFGNAIHTSELYTVNATDVANGYVQIPVVNQGASGWENVTLTAGNWYAGVELFSGGSTFDIGIIDDATVGQPAWSGAIWYPNDQAYSNGNAFAIRLNLGANTGINDSPISDVSIYPNPSNGLVNITFEGKENINITVRDISGKVVHSDILNSNSVIDFSEFGKGIYLVDITNSQGTITQKVTIQ